jgi:signal transduction histidine kinase/SAM-dependent methyltransferase
MSQSLSAPSTFAQYDLMRRKRLLQVLLPFLIITSCFTSLDYIIRLAVTKPDQLAFNLFSFAFILLSFACYGLGWLALRRNNVNLGVTLVISTTSVSFIAVLLRRILLQGFDASALVEFLLFAAILILTSLFGNIRLLTIVTILLNGVSAFVILVAASLHPDADILKISGASRFLVLGLAILFEWFVYVFLSAQHVSYRQVLHDLGGAFEQLQQLDELKDQFIAHVNHELRNPVMTMRGSVEFALLARNQLTDTEQEDLLKKALRVGDGLTHLLEGILQVRTIESGGVFDLQPVLVRQALDDALVLVNPLDGRMNQRDLYVKIPGDLAVQADPLHLQQILANLLSNALKYTPADTPIEVAAQTVATPDASKRRGAPSEVVAITIRDYGPGIPPDQISLLFNRFVRLPRDLGSRVTGSGLGLYLCRLFAEAMGGQIWVESTGVPGEGSTFHLRLPLATAIPVSLPTQAPQGQGQVQQAGTDVVAPTSPPKAMTTTGPLLVAEPAKGDTTTNAYLIPNDLRESQRLDFQHFIMREAFQGNTIAPIDHPRHILDVATGTGRWAIEMAREFPDADVVGVDMAQPAVAYAEPDQPVPANYRFQLANVLDGLPFSDGTFDYVHMRFVGIGIPVARWPDVIADLIRVTAPGGWVELMEALPMEGGGPALDEVLAKLMEVSRARGIVAVQEGQFGAWLRDGGLTDVTARTERLPFGNAQGRLGHFIALDIFTGMRAVGAGLAKSGVMDQAVFDQLMQQADEDVHSGRYQCSLPICIAYGRKLAAQ